MSQPALGTINSSFVALIEKVSNVVHKISGNRLGEKQAYMVETRVKKRMMELVLKTPAEYIVFIENNLVTESNVLVGLLTTHHTFFFREFPHFELLKSRLPDLVAQVKKRGERTISIWSAACSRGHEVYSLAMFLEHHLPKIDPTMSYKILGTDIDDESVKIANNGVYHQNEIKEIPMNFLANNWSHGSGDIAMYAKIKSVLKSKCIFRAGNLLKLNEAVKNEMFDIIFCRNVFIYFESPQVQSISKDLLSHLRPDGIFFSGISEPLSGLKLEVHSIGPSAYIHKSAAVIVKASAATTHDNVISFKPATASFEQPLLKVLCVDDSSSILTLLKKVLTNEHGFEVVATATNGLDAMEKMKQFKFDIMTLDIHMPEMDGVTYLEKNFSKSHPPVIIISSASRADADTAIRALKLGASDYVEKPALTNMEERGEEIRTKLRSLVRDSGNVSGVQTALSSYDLESQKKFNIARPETKLRLIMASISDMPSLKRFYFDLDNSQPPSIIFFEGQSELLEGMVKEFKHEFRNRVHLLENESMKLEANTIYFADFKKMFAGIKSKNTATPTSILVYGNISLHSAQLLQGWIGSELLIEDLGMKSNAKNPLAKAATDVVPTTSFSYMSCRYLSQK